MASYESQAYQEAGEEPMALLDSGATRLVKTST